MSHFQSMENIDLEYKLQLEKNAKADKEQYKSEMKEWKLKMMDMKKGMVDVEKQPQ